MNGIRYWAFYSCFLLFSNSINAQYFHHLSISPQFPTINDSILLVDSTAMGGMYDPRVETIISISNDTILVEVCYLIVGGPSIGATYRNETQLGKLPRGNYTLVIKGKTSANNTDCSNGNDFINSKSVEFDVLSYPNKINETEVGSKFNLYPNSTTDIVTLEMVTLQKSQVEILFYDVSGRVLETYKMGVNGMESKEINLEELVPGLYMLKVNQKNGKTFKIVKL